MVKIIAVANQKGGCGKSTTSINLAACLAFLGKRVLLIDLDPQAHSSIGLGVNPEELERSLFDVFDDSEEGNLGLNEIVVRIARNLDLAPAQVILSAIEQKLSGAQGREVKLSEKINSLRNAYDFIVIDCSPSLGLLTFNALSAADEVLIPVEPSFFALHGLKKLSETITLVREVVSHPINAHAVITMFDSRTKYSQDIVDEIRKFFGDNTFNVIIRKNIKLQEATHAGKPITEFDKNSLGFKDYMNLAVEVIERCGKEIKTTPQVVEEAPLQNITPEMVTGEGATQPIAHDNTSSTGAGETQTAVKVDCAPRVTIGGILFSYQPQDVVENVEIAGDFTNWRPVRMNTPLIGENVWTKVIPLSPGMYRYKYVVDGMWLTDPDNGRREANQYGGENSLIEVASA